MLLLSVVCFRALSVPETAQKHVTMIGEYRIGGSVHDLIEALPSGTAEIAIKFITAGVLAEILTEYL
jgi:hypothetical protein